MKTIFSLLLTLALGAPGFAAEDTAMSPLVPANTRHSFEKTFASVKEVHWTSNRNLYSRNRLAASPATSAGAETNPSSRRNCQGL